MSVSEPAYDASPPTWVLAAISLCAFACVMIGAVVVEPALHRLTLGAGLPRVLALAPTGRVEIGDPVLTGRYRTADAALILDFEGAAVVRADGGRLDTAPHRLVPAGQAASVSRTFAQAMTVPPEAQIEVRRVAVDRNSRLCGGRPVGWLALAVHRQGVVLMPVRQGPPPGELATDDRLCAAAALVR